VADASELFVDLVRQVQDRFLASGWTLATAESCTGGLLAHLLTEVPGSSEYFSGGVVCYANEAKVMTAGVPRETIEIHGAVSAQVAVAMAEGIRALLDADVAVAVTGIAGPGGGSEAKPVGLTYVALADDAGHEVRRFLWRGDRHQNKLASAGAALTLLLDRLAGRVDAGTSPAGDPERRTAGRAR
jgi:PncC family amidohydrolase